MHCFALLGHHLKGHKCRECGLSHMGTRKTLSLHRWKMLITLPASLFAGFLCMIAMQAAQSPLQAVLKDHREPCLCVWKCSAGNKLDSNLLLSFLSIARIEDRKPLCKKKVGYNLYFCILKKKKLLLHLFGENCIGHLCVVLLVIPRAVVWPWKQPQQGAKQESGISWNSCDVLQLYIQLQNVSQTNTRKSEAQSSRGVFSVVFLLDVWSLSVMEQPGSVWTHWFFSLFSALLSASVSVSSRSSPAFPPDHPLLWCAFLLCVKVTTVSLFLGCF